MTALSQSTKRKLSLLQLADELGNVARACKIMGYHRDTFYEVRRAFQVGGVAALVEQRRGARGPHPNRIAPEIEERVLADCLTWPTHGAQRVSNDLRLAGVEVSPSGVPRRLAAPRPGDPLQAPDAPGTGNPREHHLHPHRCPDPAARSPQPGLPLPACRVLGAGRTLNQDTFYWGTLKGVGKVYVQVVVDTFCSLAFAKVYTSKMPVTACDLLYDRVLPFYEALGVAVRPSSPTTAGSSAAAPRPTSTSSSCRGGHRAPDDQGRARRGPTASWSA